MTEKPAAKTAVYNVHFRGVTKPAPDVELFYVSPEIEASFVSFDFIILLGGTLGSMRKGQLKVAEATKREREVFSALENGSVVCITFFIDALVLRILRRIGIDFEEWEEPRVDLTIKRSEFLSFLKQFGSTQHCFYGDFDDVICETEDGEVAGFAQKVENGVLLFMPCYTSIKQFSNQNFLNRMSTALLHALEVYGPKIQYKPPTWIDSFRFSGEKFVVSEVEKLQEEIEGKKGSLETYLRMKEILWFRDHELVDSVISFFNEMGIKTKKDEIYEEDFWITEQDKETIIVEVKGLDKNLKRQHISQLDEHRAARDKLDDFPALLLVNSFNKAKSLKEKDQDISANVIKKAVRTNVLIVRTLDLCNAYSLTQEKKLDTATLLNVFKSENGWLKITESGLEIEK